MTEKEVQKVATELPFLPSQKQQVVKASERIEMQRATAQVYASFQVAIERPRDEQACYERIMNLCNNVAFASTALYRKPVGGGQHAEGVGVKATKTIMRIWGNLDAGYVEHGKYENESQFEAFCYDLETNVRFVERYSVPHERKSGDKINKVTDPGQIAVLGKARSSIEVRNCIQSIIPDFIWEEVETRCKRTLYNTVPNVPEAWESAVKRWAQVGVKEPSLFRYVNRNPKDKEKLTAADIVDLRLLWSACVEDTSTLDVAFPERDKKVNTAKGAGEPAEGKPKAATQKPGAKSPASKPAEDSAVSKTDATPIDSTVDVIVDASVTSSPDPAQNGDDDQAAIDAEASHFEISEPEDGELF